MVQPCVKWFVQRMYGWVHVSQDIIRRISAKQLIQYNLQPHLPNAYKHVLRAYTLCLYCYATKFASLCEWTISFKCPWTLIYLTSSPASGEDMSDPAFLFDFQSLRDTYTPPARYAKLLRHPVYIFITSTSIFIFL